MSDIELSVAHISGAGDPDVDEGAVAADLVIGTSTYTDTTPNPGVVWDLVGGTIGTSEVWERRVTRAEYDALDAQKFYSDSTPPTTTDNIAAGYSVGSRGIDTATKTMYELVAAPADVAEWVVDVTASVGPTTAEGTVNDTPLGTQGSGQYSKRTDSAGVTHMRVDGGLERPVEGFRFVESGFDSHWLNTNLLAHDIILPVDAGVKKWHFKTRNNINGTSHIFLRIAEDDGAGGETWLASGQYDRQVFNNQDTTTAPNINALQSNQNEIKSEINAGSGAPVIVEGWVENKPTSGAISFQLASYIQHIDDITFVTGTIDVSTFVKGLRFGSFDGDTEYLTTFIFEVWASY